jgi:hypothetical protein
MVSVVLISQGLVVITLGCWLQLCVIRVIINKATNVIDVFFMIQIYELYMGRFNHSGHKGNTTNAALGRHVTDTAVAFGKGRPTPAVVE